MNKVRDRQFWEKQRKYVPVYLFIILALFFALNFNIAEIKGFLDKYEKGALLIYLLLYVVLGVTPIPSEPVTLLVLAWKGPLASIVLATIGNTLSALVEFYLGGSINDLTGFEEKRDKLPFKLGRLPVDSPAFLLFARMLPGFGPKFVSIVSGVYRVPMGTYLWTTVVANLLGAASVTLGGAGLIALIR